MTWIQVFILSESISSLDYYQNLYYFLNTMNFSFSYGLQPECIKQLNLLHSINSIIRILISKKYSTNLFVIVLEELFLIIFIIYGIYICIYYVILVLLIQKWSMIFAYLLTFSQEFKIFILIICLKFILKYYLFIIIGYRIHL